MIIEVNFETLKEVVKKHVEEIGDLKVKEIRFSCDHKKKTIKAITEVAVTPKKK